MAEEQEKKVRRYLACAQQFGTLHDVRLRLGVGGRRSQAVARFIGNRSASGADLWWTCRVDYFVHGIVLGAVLLPLN
jgi:hypothetical protein